MLSRSPFASRVCSTACLHSNLTTTFGSVAESMLSYVKGLEPEQWDQAGQILQGGIERGLASGSAEDRTDAAGLALALAEMHVLRRQWPQSVECVSQLVASEASADSDSSHSTAERDCFKVGAVAVVVQGQDHPAADRPLIKHLRSSEDAFVQATLRLDDHSPTTQADAAPPSGSSSFWDQFAAVHRSLACIRTGQLEQARSLLSSSNKPSANESAEFVDIAEFLRPAEWRERLRAEACGGRAQLALAEKAWEDAESAASQMITHIEGCSFASRWDIAVPLSFLATAYSRTGRVVLAEGVLREASKLLELSRDRAPAWRASDGSCHVSLPSRVAWQSAQLYAVLPKRGAEAETWADISKQLWPYESDWSEESGSLNALSGAGSRGRAVVVSGWLGKAFPGLVDVK
eukprot:jgi/Ulvmu1/3293/UM153_0005.1